MKYKDMTVKELKDLFNSCYISVYIDECYGVKDMIILDGTAQELERRGYVIDDTPSLPRIVRSTA